MKKYLGFILSIFAFACCLVFSACGDKYKNLSINFFDDNGDRIENVRLVVDDNDESDSLSSARVAIRFDGIKAEDIGEVEIHTTNGKAIVTNILTSGNAKYVDLSASNSSPGPDSLVVTHLATNRTKSINIDVYKKANGVEYKNSNIHNYIFTIPETGEKEVEINANEILRLLPFDSTSYTDKVYFRSSGSSAINGVRFETAEVGGQQLISGFTINSALNTYLKNSNKKFESISLYPVLTMDGFDNQEVSTCPVNFVFVKNIDTSKLALVATNEKYAYYVANGEVIHLISNDRAIIGEHAFNNFKLNLKYLNDEGLDDDLSQFLTYQENDFGYDYFATSNDQIETFIDNGFILQARPNQYSIDPIEIKIGLTPKNCVGEIEEIYKSIYIKSEIEPTKIDVHMQNELQEAGNGVVSIDNIYDNYVSSLGARFNFNPLESSMNEFEFMRIEIETKLLNAKISDSLGTNEVFLNSNFESQYQDLENQTFGSQHVRANNNVLGFYIGGRAMKFYYDETRGKMLSEPFTFDDNIYVKAEYSQEVVSPVALSFDVFNFYNGELEYLKNITEASVKVEFKNFVSGITSLNISAGRIVRNATTDFSLVQGKYANGVDEGGKSNVVYLDRLNGKDSDTGNLGSYILDIRAEDIKMYNNRVTSTQLYVSVIGGGNNPLKLLQYNTSLGIGKELSGITINGVTNLVYNFDANDIMSNAILLVLDSNTDLGEYTIEFSQGNDFKVSVNVNVYQSLSGIEYSLNLENKNAFKNGSESDGGKSYEFSDYPADYIVAAGENLNLFLQSYILVGEQKVDATGILDEMISSVDFSVAFADETSNENEYLQLQNANGYTILSFRKGTYIDGIKILNLEITISERGFKDILTIGNSIEWKKTVSFFIYEEIKEGDVKLTYPSTRYFASSLGEMFNELGRATINLNMDADLWNYLLPAEDGEGKVSWWKNSDFVQITNSTDSQLEVSFGGEEGEYSSVTIGVTLKQFNKTLDTVACTIYVSNPVVTNRVVVEGVNIKIDGSDEIVSSTSVKVRDNANQTPYINLKTNGLSVGAGENDLRYEIVTTNDSGSASEVSNKGVMLVVVDNRGIVNNLIVEENNSLNNLNLSNHNILKILQNQSSWSDLKLYIIALDALKFNIREYSQINDIREYLLEGHERAYISLDLIISNGNESNPYLITTTEEFLEMEYSPSANYKLMTNINLANAKFNLDNFSGSLKSDFVVDGSNNTTYYTYSVFGITLNETQPNLFKTISERGKIENVNFQVNYDYNLSANNSTNLRYGVIGTNLGHLVNVSVNISGCGALNGTGEIEFGGLVGANYNEITYNSNSIVGVNGTITLSGNATTYFGGIAGSNYGKITGYENSEQENGESKLDANYAMESEYVNGNVVFSLAASGNGVMAAINILADELTNESSAIGGVVGRNGIDKLNSQGSILNAFVTGSISGNNNLGGVVGLNNAIPLEVNFTIVNDNLTLNDITNNEAFIIKNCTSTMSISGKDNLGGIVGLDEGGSYYNCHYQILSSGISGNNNVGGIAGASNCGVFVFNSVMSYRYDFSLSKENNILKATSADILGSSYVAGIVGQATNARIASLESGANQTATTTTIAYSSVNAIIKGESAVAGIIANLDGTSFLTNAYFMGGIQGSELDDKNLNISTEWESEQGIKNHTVYNSVYSRYISNDEYTVQTYIDGGDNFQITSPYPTLAYWGGNPDILDGYMFISLENTGDMESRNPIFEVAPTELSMALKDDYKDILLDGENKITDAIHLYYYSYSGANLDNKELSEYNKNYNTYSAIDLFNFEFAPKMGKMYVALSSTNSNIISVSGLSFTVTNTGECELILTSVYNPSLTARIKVFVSLPFGTEFSISDSPISTSNDNQIKVNKNIGKQLFVVSTGSNPKGAYATNSQQNLQIDVEVKENNVAVDDENKIKVLISHLEISGQKLTYADGSIGTIFLPYTTPFSVKIDETLKDVMFSINVSPYIELNYNGKTIKVFSKQYDENGNKLDENVTYSFDLSTNVGPTDAYFNLDSAIIYPNEKTPLTVYVKTDTPILLEGDDYSKLSNYISVRIDGDTKSLRNVDYSLIVTNESFVNGIETFKCYLTILRKEETEKTVYLTFEYEDVTKKIELTLLPQRIEDIEIKNYMYDLDENGELQTENGNIKITKTDILKPATRINGKLVNNDGLIILDMVPSSGYFDYLEITDLDSGNTGKYISFFQLVGVGGARVNQMEMPSSDGHGIKLYKQKLNGVDDFDLRIYVATSVSSDFNSGLRTIRVRAYSKNGIMLKEDLYTINVRMLPSIEIDYVDPTGKIFTSANENLYLALGVDANFTLSTRNADYGAESISLKFEGESLNAGDYFAIQFNSDGLYTLHATSMDKRILEQTLVITATTRATQPNNEFDEAEDQIKFKIVSFVIHNVSLTHSRTYNNRKEIYGNLNVPTSLEFYFDRTDVSFYNDGFFNKQYRYGDSYNTGNASLDAIYQILAELNTNPTAYFKLDKDDANVSLSKNIITVANPTDAQVQLQFYLTYSDGVWSITNSDPSSEGGVIFTKYEDIFDLNFTSISSRFEPDVIKDEVDFINMTYGDHYYILGNDLNLFNYEPINFGEVEDADYTMVFDGNGRSIIIHSFAEFDSEDILVGLFENIPSNMVVMNLEVIFVTEMDENNNPTLGSVDTYNAADTYNVNYKDLCTSSSTFYNSLLFGGIASSNEGVITNCKVSGYVALTASKIEDINNVRMGGLVGSNSGYITNSTSRLGIFAFANIGGFAYENSGKIVASKFDASSNFETNFDDDRNLADARVVKNYKNALGRPITKYINKTGAIFASKTIDTPIRVSAFVVDNSGSISMSYTDVSTTTIGSASTIENVLSNYRVAGFVYSNNGSDFGIKDCYSKFDRIIRNPLFSGFAYTNQGRISTSYSFINGGEHIDDAILDMFVSTNSGTIENCVEINNDASTNYDNHIIGLDSIIRNNLNKREYYKNFMFGDEKSSVWKISSTGPIIIAADEVVEYAYDREDENGKTAYYGLKRVDIEHTTINGIDVESYRLSDDGYGTKDNPILVYNLQVWDDYFNRPEFANSYYRLVRDIDFSPVLNTPSTSNKTFSGNIQGNNMTIDNVLLHSLEELDSIGLFKSLVGGSDISIDNAVRNLTINFKSITATHTSAVGTLAGIIENFNLYNIDVHGSSISNVVNGGNAVGGLAGILRGRFDVENISSTVGAFSNFASSSNVYGIYLSKNNGQNPSANLNDPTKGYAVYYSGSLIGIVDAYDESYFDMGNRDIASSGYFEIRKASVSGSISAVGDTVGSMFGFVGERVRLVDAKVNASSLTLAGRQYSGGLVGENRGVINGAEVIVDGVDLNNSIYVVGGVAGLNLAGLINNTTVTMNIEKTTDNTTVGGIVGRNVLGFVSDVKFDGKLFGLYVGGIIGADFKGIDLINLNSGSGAIYEECKFAVPTKITYLNFENTITNATISRDTLLYLIENLNRFYTFSTTTNSYFDSSTINRIRVLGLGIGLQSDGINMNLIYGYDNDKNFVINGEINIPTKVGKLENEYYDMPYMNLLTDNEIEEDYYILYSIGAVAGSFNSWTRENYGNDMLAIVNGSGANYSFITISEAEVNLKVTLSASNEMDFNLYILNEIEDSSSATLNFDMSTLLSQFNGSEDASITISKNDIAGEPQDIKDVNLSFELTDLEKIQIVISGTTLSGQELSYNYTFNLTK